MSVNLKRKKTAYSDANIPCTGLTDVESTGPCFASSVKVFITISGEVLSFYLSRFLGLDNIPPVALALVDSNASQWQDVKLKISEAGWSQNHIINQIMWIDSIG